MRLIDADTLPRHGGRGGLVHWKDIENAPTIDAVEVVRCKDCAFSRDTGDYQDTYYCDHPTHNKMHLVHSREYCYYGEEAENAETN